MTIYSRDIIKKVARDYGVKLNNHIKVRKDVHYNILSNYAKSIFIDRNKAKAFVDDVKDLQRRRY